MSATNFNPKNPFMLFEVHELCAICTKQLEEDKTCSLSSPINANTITNAYQVLETISEFKLQEDGPNFACSVCFKNIASTYKFQQICNRAQELFNQFTQYQQEHEELQEEQHIFTTDVEETLVLEEHHAFTTDVEETLVLQEHTFNADEEDPLEQPEEEIFQIVIEPIDDDSSTTNNNDEMVTHDGQTLDELMKKAEFTGEYVIHKGGKKVKLRVCPLCQKQYANNNLRGHLQRHEEFKPKTTNDKDIDGQALEDALKNAEYTGKYILHKSGNKKKRIKERVCPICQKKLSNNNLRAHLRTHDEFKHLQKPLKKVECQVCKMMISERFLPGHIQVHTGERPYVCATCGRRYINSQTLRVHERTHNDARPHVCPICRKAFKRKSYLAIHNRIHTGEKVYECSKCGKMFSYLSSLWIHEKIHSDVRNFVCKLCGKGCLTKAALESHMVFHTRERKHECAACGFKFAHLSHMRKHVKMRCKGEPIEKCYK